VEAAQGGTLFLDEVGELPLVLQAKLLRTLQNGEIQRLGSDRPRKVDVRFIAATNRDLRAAVRDGRFRADLYHRLSVYPLPIPPLRERRDDILPLAGRFLEINRARLGLRGLRLDPPAEQALLAYDWPGNVRELEHVIGRAALRAGVQAQDRDRIASIGAALLGIDAPEAVGGAACRRPRRPRAWRAIRPSRPCRRGRRPARPRRRASARRWRRPRATGPRRPGAGRGPEQPAQAGPPAGAEVAAEPRAQAATARGGTPAPRRAAGRPAGAAARRRPRSARPARRSAASPCRAGRRPG
jgi:hypothetical protein